MSNVLMKVYRCIRLIEPTVSMTLDNDRIFIDGKGAGFIEIYYVKDRFIVRSLRWLEPDWLLKLFSLHRISFVNVSKYIGITLIVSASHYIARPKAIIKELLKDE